MRKKIIGSIVAGILCLGSMACSSNSSGGGGSSSDTPAQTYGGVNLPATTLYNISDSNMLNGTIRLTSANNGMIYLMSTESGNSFNLKGVVSTFNQNSSDCLASTSLTGQVNESIATPVVSLSNCVFSGNNLTATLTLGTSPTEVIKTYNNISLTNNLIESTSQVVENINSIRAINPEYYNLAEIIYGNITAVFSNGVVINSGNTALFAGLSVGFIASELSRNDSVPFVLSNNSSVVFNMIDSTSLNLTFTNLEIESVTLNNVACNIVFTDLIKDGTINNHANGFLTGCSTSVAVTGLGQLQTITGSLNGK